MAVSPQAERGHFKREASEGGDEGHAGPACCAGLHEGGLVPGFRATELDPAKPSVPSGWIVAGTCRGRRWSFSWNGTAGLFGDRAAAGAPGFLPQACRRARFFLCGLASQQLLPAGSQISGTRPRCTVG